MLPRVLHPVGLVCDAVCPSRAHPPKRQPGLGGKSSTGEEIQVRLAVFSFCPNKFYVISGCTCNCHLKVQSRENPALCPRLGANPPRNRTWHRRITVGSGFRASDSHGVRLLLHQRKSWRRRASHARSPQASACSAGRMKRATRVVSAWTNALGGNVGVEHSAGFPFSFMSLSLAFESLVTPPLQTRRSVSRNKKEATRVSV